MNCFKENNCRICGKVFCCKKCREEHETVKHKIFADCDICIYGKGLLKNPSDQLIQHWLSQHWPLHCVFCKRYFGCMDFNNYTPCAIREKMRNSQKSPYTPVQHESVDNYETPPYLPKEQQMSTKITMFSNLATSTPLQQIEEKDSSQEILENVVTPVDFSSGHNDKKYLSVCVSLKRKVTFCETPITEMSEKKDIIKTEDKFDKIIATPNIGIAPSTPYYSAKSSLKTTTFYEDENPATNIDNNIITVEEKFKSIKAIEMGSENSTLWISAINISPLPLLAENSTTPSIIAKIKKRQIHVVVPTTIRKNEFGLASDYQSIDLATCKLEGNREPEHINRISTTDTSSILSETSLNIPSRLWSSVSKLVKNVTSTVQGLSSITYMKTPMKRSILAYDSVDGPYVKRYKLTDIKCRPPIRQLADSQSTIERFNFRNAISYIRKTADKSTQTDEIYFV